MELHQSPSTRSSADTPLHKHCPHLSCFSLPSPSGSASWSAGVLKWEYGVQTFIQQMEEIEAQREPP